MPKFVKPDLLYDYNALEPHIDTATMETHHTKHHTAYVNGLGSISLQVASNNDLHKVLSGLFSNEGLSENDKMILRNHGGGHYNHSLFWQFMSPNSNEDDISKLLRDRIINDFESLENFKKVFAENSVKVFGSGWCWWVFNTKLQKSFITTTKDQISPIMVDFHNICLLGLDVWEHAYYLKYKNERAKYVNNWWKVVNWEVVSKIHDELAISGKQVALSDSGYIVFDK